EDLDAAARISVEDAWAVRAGVICCLTEAVKTRLPNGTKEILDFTIGRQTFVGPLGMCQGSELPLTIAMQNGCYPCDISRGGTVAQVNIRHRVSASQVQPFLNNSPGIRRGTLVRGLATPTAAQQG